MAWNADVPPDVPAMRRVHASIATSMLRFTAVSTCVAAVVVTIVAWWLRDPVLGMVTAFGWVAGLAGYAESRRPDPNVGRMLLVWLTIMAVLIPLFQRAVTIALAVPLAAVGVVAAFVLERRTLSRVLVASAAVLAWQIGWLASTDSDATEVLLIAVIELLGVTTAVVAIRLVRNELLRSQARYEGLFNNVPVGLFRTTPDGTIVTANHRLASILGFDDVDGLLQTNARTLYHDPAARDTVIASIEGGDRDEIILQLRRADGRCVWGRETAIAIRDARGEVVAYEGVIEDVSDRVEAEHTARTAESRFATAFEAAPIGMALVDLRGRFTRVNRAFCDLVGRPADELTRMGWRDITPPEDERDSEEPIHRMRPGQSFEYERRFVHASGETRWGRVSISMVDDSPHRGVPSLVVQLADVTAQRRLRENLEGMVRAKDEFVAAVSHELRTPLTAVVGLTRELIDDLEDFDPAEIRELLGLVADQSTDVAHIVEDLLVAARADIGGLTISSGELDVSAELEQAIRECDHLRRLKGARVLTPPAGADAWADPVRLRQIVRNLLTNAFRYGGSTVRLRAGNRDGRAWLEVRDDGPGLPPQQWEAIFEPYHRAHEPETAVGSIGLGLSVSKRLAEAMGGDLSYRYDGSESVFTLTLPAVSPAHPVASRAG